MSRISSYNILNKIIQNPYRFVFEILQGKRVLKDFNIANEAQGVGKELIKQFPAHVSSNDLEIRFYWAGKGTTYIPYKSVNGPLISAISVQYGGLSSKVLFLQFPPLWCYLIHMTLMQ